MKKKSTTLAFVLFSLFAQPDKIVVAQTKPPTITQAPDATFALKSGDRVVFLGNSIFENDLPYGYLELALTTRYPNQQVTYRNIGWTGDTVWGEARSYISAPNAYDLMMEQLTKAQPTLVFIAYSCIEAQEGEEGLARFNQGLNKLLDKVEQLGAQAILLSPIPVFSAEVPEMVKKKNAMLELYAGAIAKTAAERGKQFIDIYKPMLEISQKVKVSDNGIHLNGSGYYHLATVFEKGLGLAPRPEMVAINVNKPAEGTAAPVKMLAAGKSKDHLTFTLEESYLPLPVPEPTEGSTEKAPVLKITGLKKGLYTLTADGTQVITASADKWKDGVEIRQGASYGQACQLRDLILKKNELFFQQYRPQNRTYILGFRSHEQGRHTKGLEELGVIISYLEGQIAVNRTPKTITYQLTAIK